MKFIQKIGAKDETLHSRIQTYYLNNPSWFGLISYAIHRQVKLKKGHKKAIYIPLQPTSLHCAHDFMLREEIDCEYSMDFYSRQ
jgi:hypothetical protein